MQKITIERTFELKFNLDDVKSNINKLLNDNKFKSKFTYIVHQQNDSINYYRIGKMNGLVAVNFDLNLISNDSNTTTIKLVSISNVNADNVTSTTLNSFVERLTMLLEGKTEDEILTESNKGCLGLVLLLIVSSALLYFI